MGSRVAGGSCHAYRMGRASIGLVFALVLGGCPDGDGPAASEWQLVHEELPGALLSVWGTSEDDVWMVGGDGRDGMGPLVIHWDGTSFERIDSGLDSGALWWVFGFPGGPVYMGGEGGTILRHDGEVFTPMTTPGSQTVFGIWGASETDIWAVGGTSDGRDGFAWRLEGDAWVPEPTLPADLASASAVWKIYGTSADDAWLVGHNGLSLHWDGSTLTPGDTGVGSALFTVHANATRYAAVGGFGTGIIVEYEDGAWHNMTPSGIQGLSGVYVGEDDFAVAVGAYGTVHLRDAAGWHEADTGYPLVESYHAVWVDPAGGVWAVGGETTSLTDGVLLHRGEMLPEGTL